MDLNWIRPETTHYWWFSRTLSRRGRQAGKRRLNACDIVYITQWQEWAMREGMGWRLHTGEWASAPFTIEDQ